MNQTDNPQPQTCKNCPEPVAEGSIGITSGMFASCSASHGDSQQQIPSSQEEGFSEETIEPEPETDSPAQSSTEQVAGAGVDKSTEESKDDETKDTENNKGAIITGTTTPAEEDSLPSNDHKRRRPTSKNSDILKLTPACASCKRAKVRCTHRRILGEDGTVSADDQTPPRPQKKTVRLRLNHPGTAEGMPEADPNAPRQTRGGSRKRKLAETEENGIQDIFELPGDGTQEDPQPPGQKRARRRRKVRNYNEEVIEGTGNSSDTARANTEEPAATTAGIAGTSVFHISRPPFPAGNLQGSTVLARHVVLSRELQQKIDDSHAKWSAAMEALQEAKWALDTWVDVWMKGE
ncbi:hypothetical protein SI65_06642 [Aspergillus cristatus]|uniref:Uncharacterized protein n=1 Tax=Aspergillus cristatus TaxID=573508 RepID=A0A1E3BAB5_ASPCR|nr:hypothetical protein SI65_06642 [Aspergillus cristatus]